MVEYDIVEKRDDRERQCAHASFALMQGRYACFLCRRDSVQAVSPAHSRRLRLHCQGHQYLQPMILTRWQARSFWVRRRLLPNRQRFG